MHFKVDEDLPPAVAVMLRDHGYVSSTVVEQEMGGWKDPQLWQAAQSHQQFLVTADKGFSNIRTYAPGSHYGILLLRPNEDGIRPLLELMEQVLASVSDLTQLSGTLAVVSPSGLRIRRAEV